MSKETNKEVICFSPRNRKFAFLTTGYSCLLTIDQKQYWHLEGYFQSQKFTGVNKKAEEHIRNALSPLTCKRVAATYRVTSERETIWADELQDITMMKGLTTKFITNSSLAKLLIETGDKKLINTDSEDEYWGVGHDGNGDNMLGQYLMKVREFVKEVYIED